jgi:uncharacterized zinc-type alcohol dehydrogenase-like protein
MFNAKAYSAVSVTSPLASAKITRREPTERPVHIKILFWAAAALMFSRCVMSGANSCSVGYPMVPGHKNVGPVTKVGSAVTKFKPRDLGAVGCLVDSDGTCPARAAS